MRLDAEVDAGVFSSSGALAQAADELAPGAAGPVGGMRRPGAGGVHGAGAGIDAAGAEPACQAQGRLQGAHAFAALAFIICDEVLPVAGGLEEAQVLVGEQAAQALRLGARGAVRVVLTEATEDAAEAQVTYAAAGVRREVVHVFGQETSAHSQSHEEPLYVAWQEP